MANVGGFSPNIYKVCLNVRLNVRLLPLNELPLIEHDCSKNVLISLLD